MPNPTDRARIGQTDLNVTRLSPGTAPIGNLLQEVPEEDAEGTFQAAIGAGIRYIDTAPYYGYGLAENRVGRTLAGQNRDDFVVSTKVGRLIRPGRRTGTEIYDGDKSFYPANPEMRFVVDHIAKPLIAAGAMESWAMRLEELAKRPNVFCKLSGMVTEADWTGWKPEDLKPYVDRVLELFGEDRVMFGSDWPVCLLASDYETVKGTLEGLLGHPTGATYAKFFGGNATDFYRL